MLYYAVIPSVMRDRIGVDPYMRGNGEELRGVEGGEKVIRIYYMRKGSIFNKRKEKLSIILSLQ